MELPRIVRKILFKEAGRDEWMLTGISPPVKAQRLQLGNVKPFQSTAATTCDCVSCCHFIQSLFQHFTGKTLVAGLAGFHTLQHTHRWHCWGYKLERKPHL